MGLSQPDLVILLMIDPWGQIFFRVQNFVDFRKTVSSIYYIKPHIRGLRAPIIKILNFCRKKL